MSTTELWALLQRAGLVQGELPERTDVRSPWFVRAMLGVAGWLGAIFLLLFVGFGMSFIIKSAGASMIAGALACAAAAILFRRYATNDFAGQFGLAVGMAGQGLILFGLASATGEKAIAPIALMMSVVQAMLFWLLPNYVHRVWTAWSGACALALALADMGLLAFTPGLMTAAFAWVWLREFDLAKQGALARAGGYGLALAAMVVAVVHGDLITWVFDRGKPPLGGELGAWAGAAFTGAALLWAVFQLLAREGVRADSAQGRIALAGAAILALATLKAPGIGPAAAVLVVGFANGNRVLAGLGVLALLGYLSHYYYSLQITLLEKSALLACTGIALLAARLALHRYWPAVERKEVSHA